MRLDDFIVLFGRPAPCVRIVVAWDKTRYKRGQKEHSFDIHLNVKKTVLRKMMPSHNRSIKKLSQEEGISEATLFNCRNEAREKGSTGLSSKTQEITPLNKILFKTFSIGYIKLKQS